MEEGIKKEQLVYYKIGSQIRRYRKEKDLKLVDLAAMTNIGSAMLSKIENGRMIPTIPTLFTIINRLGIPLEAFFAELTAESKFPGYLFLPQSAYARYEKEENARGFEYFSILEHSTDAGAFQISMVKVHPHAQRPPVTTSAFEYIYLISGALRYYLEDKAFEMQEGDSLFFDGSIAHVPVNETSETAVMLVLYLFNERVV